MIFDAVSIRNLVAPTPTTSNTIGILLLEAALPANSIECAVSLSKMTRLSAKALLLLQLSSTSYWARAMIGDAPIASRLFATKFMAT